MRESDLAKRPFDADEQLGCDLASGTYLCAHCRGLRHLKNNGAAMARKLRAGGVLGRGEGSLRAWKDLVGPNGVAAQLLPPSSGFRARRRGRRAFTPEQRYQHAAVAVAGHWRSRGSAMRTVVALCLGCGKLTVNNELSCPDPKWHRHCWHSTRKAGQLETLEQGSRRRRGRRSWTDSPTELRERFGWAVRNLLGDESRDRIAAGAGVDETIVSESVRRIVELLPDVAPTDNARLRFYVERLREAWARRRPLAGSAA